MSEEIKFESCAMGWGRTREEAQADLELNQRDPEAHRAKHARDGEIAAAQMDQWRRDNFSWLQYRIVKGREQGHPVLWGVAMVAAVFIIAWLLP